MPSPDISHQEALRRLEDLKGEVGPGTQTYDPYHAVWMSNPQEGSRYFRGAVVLADEEWYYLLTEHQGSDVYFKDDWSAIQVKEKVDIPSVSQFQTNNTTS